MIFTDRTITVRKGESRIDEPIVVYRGDYELEVRFTILNSRFKFMSGTNMIESEKASYGQLAILTPYGGNIFSDIVRCNDGSVTFVLTAEMLNQIEEVGLYSFQIRLMDYNKESRVSIPPIEFGIEVREPIASEDHDNSVNNAIVGYSIAKVVDPKEENVGDTFDESGNYNKTKWETGDRISEGKLNKIEDAIDKINKNEVSNAAVLSRRIDNNFNVLNSTKANQSDLLMEKNRIDSIIQLKDGSTTGDAELIDGRIGANNEIYSNIGEAIRSQINEIVTLPQNLWQYGNYSCYYLAGASWQFTDFDVTDIIKKNVQYTLSIKSVDGWSNTTVGRIIAFDSDGETRLQEFIINLSSDIKRTFTVTVDAAKIIVRFQVIGGTAASDSGTATASGIYLVREKGKVLKDDVKINKLDDLSTQQDNMLIDLNKLIPVSNNLWNYGDISVSYMTGSTYVYDDYDVTHEVEPGKDYIISLISACDYYNDEYILRVEAVYDSGESNTILGVLFDIDDKCKFSTPTDYSGIIVKFMAVNNAPAPVNGPAYYKGICICEKETNTLDADIEIPHLLTLIKELPENLWTFGDILIDYNEGASYVFYDYRITSCEPGKTYSLSINKVKNHVRDGLYGHIYIDDPSNEPILSYEIPDIEGKILTFTTPLSNFGSIRIRLQTIYDTASTKASTAVYADIKLYENPVHIKLQDNVYVPMAQNAINDCFELRKNYWSYGDISKSYVAGTTWLLSDYEVGNNLTPGEIYILSIGEIINNPRVDPEYSGTDNEYLGAVIQYDDSGAELSRNRFYTTTLPITFKVVDTAVGITVRLQVLSGTGAVNSGEITYKDIDIYDVEFIDGKTSLLKDTVIIQQIDELEAKIDSITVDYEDKSKWLTAEQDSFTSGTITLGTNHVSINKKLIFGADINDDFGTLTLGHGKTKYGGAYMVLDSTNVTVYSYTTTASVVKTYAHGLDISGYIDILIENNNDQKATIRIITPTGVSTETDIKWSGGNGAIFVENSDCNLTNVKASWTCTDFDKEIILCSDSYGGIINSARIPYWLKTWGYNTFILDQYAGRGSLDAITSVRAILEHCSPKYIVWLMGQNDPDTTTSINGTWQAKAEELVSICESNNIEPIFCTIPNVLGGAVDDTDIANTRHHEFKNEWIKNSGYRYIDWSAAVGADESVSWYSGMLSSDNVHPTELGARVLASRIVKDFPEITNP